MESCTKPRTLPICPFKKGLSMPTWHQKKNSIYSKTSFVFSKIKSFQWFVSFGWIISKPPSFPEWCSSHWQRIRALDWIMGDHLWTRIRESLWKSKGQGREGDGREVQDAVYHYVYLRPIHIAVWQKPSSNCKVIILQLNKSLKTSIKETGKRERGNSRLVLFLPKT